VLKAKPIDALKNVDGRRATRHGMSVAEGGGLWEGDLNTQQQYAPHPIDKVRRHVPALIHARAETQAIAGSQDRGRAGEWTPMPKG
jgi:hypothetical protein